MQRRDRPDESTARHDRREDEADAREERADQRERESDVREGVLDRWERELTRRAVALELLDESDEEARNEARRDRADAFAARRADAEDRRRNAIDRAVDRDRQRSSRPAPEELAAAGTATLLRLARLGSADGSLSETLDAVVAVALEALPGAEAVTLTLSLDGQLQAAACSAPWAGALDELQLRRGHGPILEAFERPGVAATPDLGADRRWDFGGEAGPSARRGMLSAAILGGGDAFGTLNVYVHPGGSLEEPAVATTALLSTLASVAVGWSLDRLGHRAQTEAWERALASRDLIGQAKGILMEQESVGAEAAFDLLRRTSQGQNRKVRDVAEHVAEHRRLPEAP